MNRPFKPVAPAGVSTVPAQGTPATPHGTSLANYVRAEGEAGVAPFSSVSPTSIGAANATSPRPTGEAGAPNLSITSMPCRHCEGEGEAEYMGLTEDRYHWRECHVCEGSRVEAPYCEICSGKLTCDLYCTDCDEWAALTYVERISPTRVAL